MQENILYTRLCPKAPLAMKQLLPPIFLFHLVQSFRYIFFIFVLPFFLLRLTLAQIKRFGTLNATLKTRALYKAPFLKKSGKVPKNSQKCNFVKNGQFLAVFLDFFKNGAL